MKKTFKSCSHPYCSGHGKPNQTSALFILSCFRANSVPIQSVPIQSPVWSSGLPAAQASLFQCEHTYKHTYRISTDLSQPVLHSLSIFLFRIKNSTKWSILDPFGVDFVLTFLFWHSHFGILILTFSFWHSCVEQFLCWAILVLSNSCVKQFSCWAILVLSNSHNYLCNLYYPGLSFTVGDSFSACWSPPLWLESLCQRSGIQPTILLA